MFGRVLLIARILTGYEYEYECEKYTLDRLNLVTGGGVNMTLCSESHNRKSKIGFMALVIMLLLCFGGESSVFAGTRPKPCDLALVNATIATMDIKHPNAQALAVRGDKIISVGTNEDIRPYIGPSTRVLDLSGKFVMPGFIDGHAHLLLYGQSKMELDLKKAKDWNEIIHIVGESVRKARPGQWIVGSGWHQEKWDKVPSPQIEGYPTDDSLNEVSPNNPVLLTHASGHALFANAKARELAGVSRDTKDPEGGRILRNTGGNPEGVFFDSAQSLIESAHQESLAKRTPEQIETESREAISLAVNDCLTKGVTSFQDAASSFKDIDLFKKLVDEDNLGIRLWVMIHEDNKALAKNLARYRIIRYGKSKLTVRAIKKFMDGALGSMSSQRATYSKRPDSPSRTISSFAFMPLGTAPTGKRSTFMKPYSRRTRDWTANSCVGASSTPNSLILLTSHDLDGLGSSRPCRPSTAPRTARGFRSG